MGIQTVEKMIVNPRMLYLEESKKNYLLETYQKGIEKRDCVGYKTYINATILPINTITKNGRIYGKVGVLKDDGTYIEESSVDNLFRGGYVPDVWQVSNKSAVYLGCDHNAWGHFLVNVVPRVWIAFERDLQIDEYVIVRDLDSDSVLLSDNQILFFEYLGILDKVRVLNVAVQYSIVIVPEASYRAKEYIAYKAERGMYFSEFTKTFDVVVKKALKNCKALPERKSKKVFFSRLSHVNGHKTDIGVELVNSFFRNNGYFVVYPENLSLTEMIYLLHCCESVAYISGTLQHNMLFGPQNMKAIAVERRIILSLNQTDIDLIKNIQTTYISTQYTILPGNRARSSIYTYSVFLQKFIKENKMNPPNFQYTTCWHLKRCIREYLRHHIWTLAWEDSVPSPYNSFYFEALADNLREVEKLIPEIGLDEGAYIRDSVYWKNKFQDLLIRNHIPYSQWDEKDMKKLIRSICILIEKNLENKKNQFLIYPYGVNGIIIENILQKRYEICPKIFDNSVSNYNGRIMKLNKIQEYITENTCVILTSCNIECRKELEKYCPRDRIIGPYTVF